MSTYLVTKRIHEDRDYMPGETVVDPPWAAILMERGYLVPVPDGFTYPTAAPAPEPQPEPASTPTPEPPEPDKKPTPEVTPAVPPELPKVIDLSEVVAEEPPTEAETTETSET